MEHADLDALGIGEDQLHATVVVWSRQRIWSFCRGQKVENLRRDPRCTVLVDRAERFPELQGVMIQGEGRVFEDLDAETVEEDLIDAKRRYHLKYEGGYGEHEAISPLVSSTARGRSWRWVVVTPRSVISWDNKKFAGTSRAVD